MTLLSFPLFYYDINCLIMKKSLIFITALVSIFLFSTTLKAADAGEILKQVAAELSKGVESEFVVSSIVDKKTAEEQFAGTLIMKGDRYMLDSPGLKIWYDGATQWTYNTDDDEVTIAEVSPDEENSFNIMSIINNKDKYVIHDKGTESLLGKKYRKIELQTRHDEKDVVFKKVTFLIGKDNLPHSLAAETRQGENYILIFTKTGMNLNIKDSVFVFPSDAFKNAYINALR